MQITLKEACDLVHFLKVARADLQRAYDKEENKNCFFAECWKEQIDKINRMIDRIENSEI